MGELKGKKKNGYGICLWPDGAIYEGFWLNDVPFELGIIAFSNGDVYQGEIDEGRPMRLGVLTSTEGFSFSGQFVNGEPHGLGEESWSSGVVLRGSWLEGRRHGQFEVAGNEWTLKGHFEKFSSVGFVVAKKAHLKWEFKIVNGQPHGDFSCQKLVQDDITMKGTLVKGVVNGPVKVSDKKNAFTLTYDMGVLKEVKNEKEVAKGATRQNLDDFNLDEDFREFVNLGVEVIKDFVIPNI